MSFQVHREPRTDLKQRRAEVIGKKHLEVLLKSKGVPQKENTQAVIDHDHLMENYSDIHILIKKLVASEWQKQMAVVDTISI